jgi:hypothetical protein
MPLEPLLARVHKIIGLMAGNTAVDPNLANLWVADSVRIKLLSSATFYVATTGNDTTGVGTSGSPWLTLQKAYNYICSALDLGGAARLGEDRQGASGNGRERTGLAGRRALT